MVASTASRPRKRPSPDMGRPKRTNPKGEPVTTSAFSIRCTKEYVDYLDAMADSECVSRADFLARCVKHWAETNQKPLPPKR